MNPRHAGLLLVATAIALGGCSDRKLRPLNPCTVTGVVRKVTAENIENVDLLMLVDNSKSMAEEQAAIKDEFPNMVNVLLTGHDPAGQIEDFPPVKNLRVGVITSDMGVLGVGVVQAPVSMATSTGISSCGLSGATVDSERAFFGDDGAIQLTTPLSDVDGDPGTPDALPPGCEATYPGFLAFQEGGDVDAFVEDVSCTAVRGTNGCGFEMQLESVLVAVTDSTAHPEIAFVPNVATGAPRDRVGRATPGQSNASFFRENSVKAIILVSDEEDCSTDNPEMFMFNADPDNPETTLADPDFDNNDATGDPTKKGLRVNTRCFHFGEELYNVQRYVDGLRNLSPGDPNKVVFAAIVGVPQGLETAGFDDILARPDMQYQDIYSTDGSGNTILEDATSQVFSVPACFRCGTPADGDTYDNVTNYKDCPDPTTATAAEARFNERLQIATPGRRYVELAREAQEAGMNAVVRSICDKTFSSALGAITGRIADVLRGACLPRALNPDATGRVNCDVVEILPGGVTCAERASVGRDATPVRIDTINGVEREVCRVNQLVPTQGDRDMLAGPDGVGWYYDDYTADMLENCKGDGPRQRISFSTDADPFPGSDIRLECLQPVQGGGLEGPDIFLSCDPGVPADTNVCSWQGGTAAEQAGEFIVRYNLHRDAFFDANGNLAAQALFCESSSRTCQIACDNAAQCPGGFVCFDPETNGSTCADAGHPCYCVNPTCAADSSGGGGTVTPTPDAGM